MTGGLTISTCTGAASLAGALVAAFAAKSGVSARVDPRQTSAGLHALSAGVAGAAIVDRPAREAERRPYRQIIGREARSLRIGQRDPARIGRAPAGAYVQAASPLAALPLDRLGRIFTAGGPGGDIVVWGQLGMTGPFAARRIHLYGPPDDGGFLTNVRLDLFGGRQLAPAYETLPDEAQAIAAILEDRTGIALLDERPEEDVRGLRRLSLLPGSARPPLRNALDPALLLLVGADPLGIEFARYALSVEGQGLIARDGGASGVQALDRDAAHIARAALEQPHAP